jgi:hypothetical protein
MAPHSYKTVPQLIFVTRVVGDERFAAWLDREVDHPQIAIPGSIEDTDGGNARVIEVDHAPSMAKRVLWPRQSGPAKRRKVHVSVEVSCACCI